MRQLSSVSLKPLDRFTSKLVCSIFVTVTPKFSHMISIGPFYGSRELKIEKNFRHLPLQNQLVDDRQTLSGAFLGSLLSNLLILI
jgi:hypothetical protein